MTRCPLCGATVRSLTREDIRRRAEWTPERVDECGDAHWFRRNSRRFLAQHPRCRIVIRDEYGREHPIEGDDT